MFTVKITKLLQFAGMSAHWYTSNSMILLNFLNAIPLLPMPLPLGNMNQLDALIISIRLANHMCNRSVKGSGNSGESEFISVSTSSTDAYAF
jgi:hypothetical protein